MDVKTFAVSAQADAQLRQPLLQVAARNRIASTIPSASTISTKPRHRRNKTRQNTPASLIALSVVNATTRSPSGNPSAGIATIGAVKMTMTGAKRARQTTATTF